MAYIYPLTHLRWYYKLTTNVLFFCLNEQFMTGKLLKQHHCATAHFNKQGSPCEKKIFLLKDCEIFFT